MKTTPMAPTFDISRVLASLPCFWLRWAQSLLSTACMPPLNARGPIYCWMAFTLRLSASQQCFSWPRNGSRGAMVGQLAQGS